MPITMRRIKMGDDTTDTTVDPSLYEDIDPTAVASNATPVVAPAVTTTVAAPASPSIWSSILGAVASVAPTVVSDITGKPVVVTGATTPSTASSLLPVLAIGGVVAVGAIVLMKKRKKNPGHRHRHHRKW